MTNSKIYTLLLPAALLLLSACTQPSEMAKVTRVIDGDTIVIEGGYHVRYIGIDTPEENEPYYLEAKQKNKDLVEGKKVWLEKDISDNDKYGRKLRYVYVGNTFVNAELVRQGYAYAKSYPPDIKYQVYLEAIETEAQQAKRGIWEQN